MDKHPFEDEAAGLFAAPPAMDGEAEFLARVEHRLVGFVRVRRLAVIAAAGLGAALAAKALAASPLLADISAWTAQAASLTQSATTGASTQVWLWLTLILCAAGLAAASTVRRI
ncbi:MAG: hypothetical protein WCI21_10085 [Alphaproteobacteria bacterium]